MHNITNMVVYVFTHVCIYGKIETGKRMKTNLKRLIHIYVNAYCKILVTVVK